MAKFEHFTTYGSEKGAEWVFSNNIQFRNFVVFDQSGVGLETKTIVLNEALSANIPNYVPTFYNEQSGPSIIDTLIVGNTDNTKTSSLTESGIVLAWDRGQLIKNVTFVNFPNEDSQAFRGPTVLGKCL